MPAAIEPTPWTTIQAALRDVVADRKLSTTDLSAMTGLSRSTVQSALLSRAETQWGTAARLLAALGLNFRWVHTVAAKRKPAP